MTWASILIRPNEYGVVMRRVLIDQVPVHKVGNNVCIQPSRLEKICKYAVHIRVRNGRYEGLLRSSCLLFCLRVS